MCILFFVYYLLIKKKKKTCTGYVIWEAEYYVKYDFQKSSKNQLHNRTEEVFQNYECLSKSIYMLPRMVTVDTKLRNYQQKLLSSVFFIRKMLFKFNNIDFALGFSEKQGIKLMFICFMSSGVSKYQSLYSQYIAKETKDETF